jgi:adenosylcobinamide kinase / adenosylcobinamide-phosphate guanylyltransferase
MKDNNFIFITGGARSGKSALALDKARESGGRVVYIATAEPGDAEMKERIRRHREERPRGWRTIEEPLFVADAVRALPENARIVVIDCATLLVSNMLLAGWTDTRTLKAVRELSALLTRRPGTHIVVSNEVGAGIVPDNALARRFRDTSGRSNALLAARAHEAWVCFCGIPMKLK